MMAYPEVRPDLAKDMVAGLLMAAPFIYAQSCFYAERQHGTLQFLLALPIALGAPNSFLDCGPADAAISSLGEVAMVCVPRNPPGLSRPPVRTRDRYRFLLVLFSRSTELIPALGKRRGGGVVRSTSAEIRSEVDRTTRTPPWSSSALHTHLTPPGCWKRSCQLSDGCCAMFNVLVSTTKWPNGPKVGFGHLVV